MLQETVGRALKLSQEAAARMEELQIQLSVLQRQCTYRDRPLCDTLRIRSFEENGVVDALKTVSPAWSRAPLCVCLTWFSHFSVLLFARFIIFTLPSSPHSSNFVHSLRSPYPVSATICQLQEDQSIFRMRYLGEIEFGSTVKNLTSEVGVSRSIFSNFPQQVKHDTAYERNCKSTRKRNVILGMPSVLYPSKPLSQLPIIHM